MAFLPGIGARRYLQLPTQEQIDLRAACFCHKKIVDIGYVCSVCLSSEPPLALCFAATDFLLWNSLLQSNTSLHDMQDALPDSESTQTYGHRRRYVRQQSSGSRSKEAQGGASEWHAGRGSRTAGQCSSV